MKYHAFGAILQYESAVPGTYVNVTEIKDVTGPGEALDTVDATTHTSPSATREFLAGLVDSGEVGFSIVYDPSNTTDHQFLRTSLRARTLVVWRIVSLTGNADFRKFSGYVTQFEPKDPVEGLIEADLSIKVTGVVTNGVVA
tara:strand:+ start:8001 stop:8426 length:426 start_codon:yes stop_codon:yes gene_type:complete